LIYFVVDDRSVTVASHAKCECLCPLVFLHETNISILRVADFMLGKPHKEVAALMLQLVEDDASTEQQIIKEIALKTKQFLDTLEGIIPQGESVIDLETVQAQELPPAMSRFLWNLAIAEGKAQM